MTTTASAVHRDPVAKAHRSVRAWVYVVAASAFGPYVHGHIDAGQLAVAISALAVILVGCPRLHANHPLPFWLIAPWALLYIAILISTAFRPSAFNPYGSQPSLDALGAYALPMALVLLAWFWKQFLSTRDLTLACAEVFVIGTTMNALMAIAELATGNVQSFSVIQQYWSLPTAVGTVGLNASVNGRYIGIFYQPAIAGVAYGVALFCSFYICRVCTGPWAKLSAISAVILSIGGIISISKVFLLGALPIALVVTIVWRMAARSTATVAVLCGTLTLADGAHLLPSWSTGGSMLSQLIHPRGSLLTTFSAGRYGSGSVLSPVASFVLHTSPELGYGAGGLQTAYDSLWIDVLVLAGITGIVVMIGVIGILAVRWLHWRRRLQHPEWILVGAVLALVVGSSFGVPSLVGDRISVMEWLLFGITLTLNPVDVGIGIGEVEGREPAPRAIGRLSGQS